jgi:hypothetical protein
MPASHKKDRPPTSLIAFAICMVIAFFIAGTYSPLTGFHLF